jgi:hypothetical protein
MQNRIKQKNTITRLAYKKSLQGIALQAPFVSDENKQAKGEEKPEEELMGKRKSSPCS